MVKMINGFVYFVRRIPVVGKKIPSTVYKIYPIKQIVTVVSVIISIFFSILMQFIKLGLFIVIMFFIEGENALTENIRGGVDLAVINNGLFIWFFFIVILRNFYAGVSFSVEQKLIDFYDHFLLKKADVIRGESIIDRLYQGLTYIPAALILGVVTANRVFLPLFIVCSYLAFSYLFLYFGRMIYTWQLSNKNRIIFNGFFSLFIIGIGVGLYYFQISQSLIAFFTSWLGILFLAVILAVSLWLFLHFKQENEFINFLLERSTIQVKEVQEAKKSQNQYLSEGLRMQKNLVLNAEKEFQSLSGSNYLNALLFSRYRSILNKSLRYRFYYIASAWIIIIVASLLGAFKHVKIETITTSLPGLFFIMYFATFGKKVVQMVFVNCDVSMLYYPFYREPKTIITGFNYRFKQTFYYNSIISAGIFVCYLLLHLLNDFLLDWQFFSVLLLALTALAFLFSFHELFIYYLLQPFTGDMSVVSPLYKFVSVLLYWISYISMQLSSLGYFYVVIISIGSLIYVFIGFIVVYKMASKTFKIRS
ncbi:hypothetical protein BCR26_12860 [Enterococcus rivorum]|uniref:Uncharacterized protein n=2 Tax=Enterococcus rivorum TaxID=762845 RepID=A0A1E5KXK6_9ENTE|nr:hypothetical protein BCR26_12860 [Enterococcus rivorum]